MTQEFFNRGASVEVIMRDEPTAEEEDDLIVQGYVIERDQIGLLLDSGAEYGQTFIPWSNIAQVLAVEFVSSEDTDGVEADTLP